jgi:hypothetical protein
MVRSTKSGAKRCMSGGDIVRVASGPSSRLYRHLTDAHPPTSGPAVSHPVNGERDGYVFELQASSATVELPNRT